MISSEQRALPLQVLALRPKDNDISYIPGLNFVALVLNFRVRMLLKSAVRLPKKKSIFIQSVNEVSLRSPRSMCRSLQLNQFHRFVALFTSIQPGTSPKHSTSLPVVSTRLFPFHQLWVTYLFFVPFENANLCIHRRKLFFLVWQ